MYEYLLCARYSVIHSDGFFPHLIMLLAPWSQHFFSVKEKA